MRNTLLVLALVLSFVAPSIAEGFESGKWYSVSKLGDEIHGGANFTVSKNGVIRGKGFFYNGDISRISGKMKKDGTFTIIETLEGYRVKSSGKLRKSGADFEVKTDHDGIVIKGHTLPADFPEAGAYIGSDSYGHPIVAVATGKKTVTAFAAYNNSFLKLFGAVSGKTLKMSGGGVNATGTVKGKRVTGTARLGLVSFTFSARRL